VILPPLLDFTPRTLGYPESPAVLAEAVSRGRFVRPAHIRVTDAAIVRLVDGGCRGNGLVVCEPPRHGKSELCSRYTPAWFLGRHPEQRVLLTSYGSQFASEWGRKARDLVADHPDVFRGEVAEQPSAAAAWGVAGHAGGMSCAGAGGPITGKPADLLILDDPVQHAEDAASASARAKSWDWWRSVALTRLEPGGRVLVIGTRWHEDDPPGRNIAEDRYEVLLLPALAEHGDPLGRAEGEALWPERYPVSALEEKRTILGSYWWNALYQQRPSPAAGAVFRRDWFRYYDTAPEHSRRYSTADLAVSAQTSRDYTCLAVWGASGEDLYLLDLVRERLDAPAVLRLLADVQARWAVPVCGVETWGRSAEFREQLRATGLPMRELKPDKDKVARAIAATPHFEAGRVFFPRQAPWLPLLESELLGFPAGSHDDQVDAVVYGVICRRELAGAGLSLASAAPSAGVAATLRAREKPWRAWYNGPEE